VSLLFLPDWDWANPDYAAVWRDRMAKLKALRADPDRWDELKAFYKTHPAEWIHDWCVTFDPRNIGTGVPTTMPFLLFKRQEEFILWLYERWQNREDGLVEKSRDMGVSWLCCAFSVWMWSFHRGSVVGFGSRKEDYVDKIGDPSSLFWKIRTIIDLLPVELRPDGYDHRKHAPFMRVLNVPGESVIVGEAGDNIGRGARASLYIKDESAFWEHPEASDAALSQTANCQIDVSTPNGEGNPFWQKAHGGKIRKFVFDWRQDPRKDPKLLNHEGKNWYERQKERLTPTALAQEVDRDYSASISNSFIAGNVVSAAQARGPADVKANGPIRVGLDVARFGDDRCVLTIRRGRVVLRQVSWGKVPIEATAGRAKQEISRYPRNEIEQIAVDVIGLGAGAADLLRGWFGDIVVDVNSSLRMSDGENYNMRAFMWSQMRDWLPTASIPNNPETRVALTATRYGYKGGELLLESKDDMKKRGVKSPDEGDSLALTFAYPGSRRPPAPPPASRVVVYDTDPEMGM
jgi:phage terminase large subunit